MSGLPQTDSRAITAVASHISRGWSARVVTSNDWFLLGISCPSTTDCLAVGLVPNSEGTDDGVLEKTSNAGSSWSSDSTLSPGTGLNSISCSSITTCVAVGGSEALVTNDAGESWTSGSIPSLPPDSDDNYVSVTCPDSQFCVAVANDGNVVTTNDGGLTWSEASIPAPPQSVIAPPPSEGKDSLERVFFEAVTCPTSLECLAVGVAVYNSESSNTTENLLVTTSDGGQSWQTMTFAGEDSNGPLNSVECPSSEQCLAVGTTTVQLQTSDAGMTWSIAGTRGAEFKTAQTDPNGLWCFTDSTCIVVGAQESVTRDGGRRWQRQTGRFVNSEFEGIDCVSDSSCWAVGEHNGRGNGADGAIIAYWQ